VSADGPPGAAAGADSAAEVLVSVVIPAYEPGPDLRTAVRSVLAQSEADLEVLVVDDGSVRDVTWVAGLDPRVRVVRQPHAGVSTARNTGTARARGEWVAFLDDDDVWEPDKLRLQLEQLTATGADLGHTAFVWTTDDAGGGTSSFERRYPRDLTYRRMLAGDHVCTSSVVVRRSVLVDAGGFAPGLDRAEDLDLWLRLLRSGARFAALDVPLLVYRTHAGGASADYDSTYRQRRRVLVEHLRAARRGHDTETVAAARRGLRRGRELSAAQAFDAARATAGAARARHLLRATTRHPRFVVESWRQARASRREARRLAAAS
jgi:glycosyltransferase involved in cell wall biosynthesis